MFHRIGYGSDGVNATSGGGANTDCASRIFVNEREFARYGGTTVFTYSISKLGRGCRCVA